MTCDFQRSKCYSWEDLHVHKRDKSHVAFDQVQSLIDYVWGCEGLKYAPQVKPMPKQTRKALASANRLNVWVPEQGLQTTVILHELAHSLTCDHNGLSAQHNGRFVGVFIGLLSKYAGFSMPELLYTAKSAGVDVNFKGRII